MLELIDIKKRYGSKEVLHGISIKFENGIYGLIGPNGSGKSTIMNIMSDVLDMSSGKFLFNGTYIIELDFIDLANYRIKSIGLLLRFAF